MLVTIEGKKGKEWLAVSSRQIAEDFEKRHDHVLRDIENIISYVASNQETPELGTAEKDSELSEAAPLFFKTFYKVEGNTRKYPEYLMNKDGFALLAMGFTGEKAMKWKLRYINAFNSMKKTLERIYAERQQWEIERAKGILVRHILTDTIKNVLPESPHKKFAYPRYTNLIYTVLFGKTAKDLQAEFKLQKNESVRDQFTKDDLAEVENLERLTAGLINLGWGYPEIKDFLETNVHQRKIE